MRCVRLLLLVLVCVTAVEAGAIGIANEGKSDYVICVSADAIAPEQTAARELQGHLQAVTGANLPIVAESEAAGTTRAFVVGPCERFRSAFPDVDLASLKHDGIVMKTSGDTVYLCGGRPRGTLYAVYTFLEDVVGCRWWTAKESFAPSKPSLAIPELNTVYAPKLQYREAFYRGAFDGVFAARSKCNGHHDGVASEYGDHYRILGWCHTFYAILPPDQYFAAHPEWYSEIDGKRTAENAQLCLSNEEMRAEFIKNALDWVRKDPEAGIISIAQNDCGGACQCAKCRALLEEEGAESGPLLRFVNAVAEAIGQEFPGTLVETLAYTYTRQVPKAAKPRENVIVRLCSIECSFSQPLATGPQNEPFRRDMEAWSAISHQLYVWDYVTNFCQYLLPHPNLRVLAPNVRFFVDHKAIGLFEQGDAGSTCSDFPELRAWLLAHLMWDPSRDENALIREFLEGYYGAAAEPLLQYINLMCDAMERSGAYLTCYMATTSGWLPVADLEKAVALFDLAEARVAENDMLRQRVRRARIPLDYARLNRLPELRRIARTSGVPWSGPADPAAFCEEFIKTANSFDVGQYAEGRPFSDCEKMLRDRLRPDAPAPKACAGLAETEWVEIQDNEFVLYAPGVHSAFVDDAKASDGRAARMSATHGEWAVQLPVPLDIVALGPVKCFVAIRSEAKAASGGAFTVGIYDPEKKASVVQRTVPIEECGGGEYGEFDLGAVSFANGMYLWVCPLKNPEQMEAVYVDRVFFVRSM